VRETESERAEREREDRKRRGGRERGESAKRKEKVQRKKWEREWRECVFMLLPLLCCPAASAYPVLLLV
jgi:hypothetical protein